MSSHLLVALFLSTLLILLIPLHSEASANMMPGGMNPEERVGDEDVQEIANQVKEELGRRSNGEFKYFEVVSYTTQLVAGVNYFMKIKVGPEEYIHARVFVPLPFQNAPPEVSGVQTGKAEGDKIEYF